MMMGVIAKSVGDALAENPAFRKALEQLGGKAAGATGYLAVTFLVVALLVVARRRGPDRRGAVRGGGRAPGQPARAAVVACPLAGRPAGRRARCARPRRTGRRLRRLARNGQPERRRRPGHAAGGGAQPRPARDLRARRRRAHLRTVAARGLDRQLRPARVVVPRRDHRRGRQRQPLVAGHLGAAPHGGRPGRRARTGRARRSSPGSACSARSSGPRPSPGAIWSANDSRRGTPIGLARGFRRGTRRPGP